MKPAWDRLAQTFKKSKNVVIADVDCTAGGQSVCQRQGVKGYPTIKYYIGGTARDYQGGRDFDALKKFVETKMGPPPPPCNLKKRKKTCSKREMKFINKMEGNDDEIEEQLQKLTEKRDKKHKKGNKKFIGWRWVETRIRLLKQMGSEGKTEL